ncbi:MAG TPA: MFS transporter [Miltoncostaeaceae bacterium]|nr:MFS transporter [Miltoncostaeaceae bacterium]
MTVLIDLIGFGIVLPILPLWAERFGASPTEIGLLTAFYSLMQVIFAPVWGRLSDRVGRRPVILVTLAGSALSALLIGLAGTLWVLFLARILNGISGASYAAAQAYVADVTTREDRARGMGMIGAAFGLGFILGPALGAAFAAIDPSAPFFAAAALAAANFAVAWVRLPESRPPGARSAAAPARASALRRALATRDLGPLLVLSFLATLAFVGMESTFALLGDRRFGYDAVDIGLLFAYVGVAAAVGQGLLVGRLVARHGEHRVMLLGLVGTALGLALLAAAQTLALLLIALPVLGVASGLAFATVTALISHAASEEGQGGALGVAASTGGLARIVGPVAAGLLFQHAGPAAPLVAGAVLTALCLLPAMRVTAVAAPAPPAPARPGTRA